MLKAMKHFLRHLLLPRHSNNQRAKLLHHDSIFFLVILLVAGSLFISTVKKQHSNVLGISVNVSVTDLLNQTNQKRAEAGLAPLTLNDELSQAAAGKANDMFAKNYWAHVSPTGTTPWDFIHGAGYHYIYAGENLARGFNSATDVINAWMASSGHRANLLSANYKDVGFAVQEGSLTGDSDTVLVVQEFGSRSLAPAQAQAQPVVEQVAAAQKDVVPSPTPTAIPTMTPVPSPSPIPAETSSTEKVVEKPLIDSIFFTRAIGVALVLLFIVVFAIDLILVGKKNIVRIVGHNIDHILFLVAILIIATMLGSGIIF